MYVITISVKVSFVVTVVMIVLQSCSLVLIQWLLAIDLDCIWSWRVRKVRLVIAIIAIDIPDESLKIHFNVFHYAEDEHVK